MYKGSFSTASPTLAMFCLFDNSHSNRCELTSHCGFDLHFPDGSWCWASFHIPVGHLCTFWEIIQVLCLFLTRAALCYWLVGVPYIFWILTSYQTCGLQIFSPFCRLPFHFLIKIFLSLFIYFDRKRQRQSEIEHPKQAPHWQCTARCGAWS